MPDEEVVQVMDAKGFLSVFKERKPVMAMLHLKGETPDEVLERAKRELDLYIEGGVDAVIVEDYFGTYGDMRRALEYIREAKSEIVYGVNCLNIDAMGFELAQEFDAAFVQLDSVVGHVRRFSTSTAGATTVACSVACASSTNRCSRTARSKRTSRSRRGGATPWR